MWPSATVVAWYSSAQKTEPTNAPPARCPNGTIKIVSEMRVDEATGKKKRALVDYQYDLGDCMFCQLCTNACNFDAIEFTNDFENAVFDRDRLVLHLDKEVYQGGSLPGLIDGGAPLTIGKFNTKTK